MRQNLLLVFLFFFLVNGTIAQSLVHYWNFNNSTSEVTLLEPTQSVVSGSSIAHNAGANSGGFVSAIQTTSNSAQGFEITNPNARNGNASLTHLRFNNPIGGNLVFSLPTIGYSNIVVKYATRRSGQGAHNQVIDYTTNGTTFTNLTILQPVDGNPTLQTLDFSGIPEANNNPNFKVRISFTQGGGGLEGNNRFDNFTLEGEPVLTEQLIHYWNFNDASSVANLTTPNIALVPGSSITQISNGTIATIDLAGTGQNFNLENLNARNGDPSGTHLRYNDPIGGNLIFALPTTGVSDFMVKYVTRRSGSGAGTQVVEYTTDGSIWKPVTNLTITETPTLITLNFTDSIGVNNNPNFKLRFGFLQGSAGTVGNNRFDNFTLDGKASISDNTPPSVVFVPASNATGVLLNFKPTLTFNKPIRLIDNSPITNDNVAGLVEFRLNNATGALVPFTATIDDKVITLTPNANLLPGTNYYVALKANVIEGENDIAIEEIKSVTFTTVATSFVSFAAANFVSVSEGGGIALVTINLTNPVAGSFKVNLMPSPWSNATANSDFVFASTTINTTAAFPSSISFAIPIIDDNDAELDEYFVIGLEDLNGITLQGRRYLTVYIRDNDRKAPVPNQEITLNYISSFKPTAPAGSTVEITAFDPVTKRLFMTSGIQNRIDIADFSDPNNIQHIKGVDMSPYGGGINSVGVLNGMVAVAVDNANAQANGSVVFLNTDGDFQKQVTVGAMPDMLIFTPDGTKILTANEGEPNNAYTVDPEGSVSIIDVSGGIASIDQSKVSTVFFNDFNSQEASLIAAGVRKTFAASTLSQDLEPEYITFSSDGTKAWVACQENNSIAELDIAEKRFTRIWGLGMKDFNTVAGGGLDASNNGGVVHISNWPVKSFYMPDAISSYSVGGKTYIVTANEGDEKELAGLNERTTVGNNAVVLDPDIFPHAAMLKEPFNIGNFRISNLNGDTNGDGKYDQLVNIGARSFSVWDAETGALVWDSKDQIELFISQHPSFGAIFNADHESNGLKGRSHSKGPEPEGLTIAEINGQQYAFVVLERIGGTLVYNITDPANPYLVDYRNERTLNAVGGDRGGESVIYIKPDHSPNGKGYALVSNEVSGTLTVYEIGGIVLPVNLITYTASVQNNGTALLQWSTATERNSSHFKIERSYDGRTFSEIGKVKAAGSSDTRNDYTFTDAKPGSGKIFYRLNQQDIDGTLIQKGVRVIDMGAANGENWIVSPNPVRGSTMQLNMGKYSGTVLVKLMDAQGRVIMSQAVQVANGAAKLSLLNKVNSGVYFLYIEGHGTQRINIVQ